MQQFYYCYTHAQDASNSAAFTMIGWHLVLLLLVPVRGQVPLSVGFTEEPESTVALKGDSVFLHCKTNNEEANSKLRWLHNDTLISQANKDYEVRPDKQCMMTRFS